MQHHFVIRATTKKMAKEITKDITKEITRSKLKNGPHARILVMCLALTACGQSDVNNIKIASDTAPNIASDAAAPPNTDIYMADIIITDQGLSIQNPKPVAVGAGYDNQPYFLPDSGSFVYSSQGESGKTDIWRYEVLTGQHSQITNSPEQSEYSPRLMPNKTHIAFIQENPTGDDTRLHKIALPNNLYSDSLTASVEDAQNRQEPKHIIEFGPLGYYAFTGDEKTAFVFYRSEPPTLYQVDVASGVKTKIANNIGRPLHPSPNGDGLYFTINQEEGPRILHFHHKDDGKTRALFPLKGATEEFALFPLAQKVTLDEKVELANSASPDLTGFLTADGGAIYYRTDNPSDQWQKIADFTQAGLSNISRMSVSQDKKRIALVTNNQN